MKKLIPSLVFILVMSSLANVSLAASFADVDEGNRFYDEIQYLTNEGVISGFSEDIFKPRAEVTRAQAAIMLGRALGYDGTQRITKFEDVTASQAASGYIASAVADGVISGYTDGTYRPYQTVTRAEMAIFIARAFDLAAETDSADFDDVGPSMSSYNAIMELAAAGVAAGYGDGSYRPYTPLNREQFSAFLARAVNPTIFAIIPEETLDVTFLDVGQGGAILVEYPNGEIALVDAGRYATVIKAALEAQGVTQIDTFIATHPDADHIGGAAFVIENYGVTQVVDSGQVHTTETFANYLSAVEAAGATFEIAEIGDELSDDAGVNATVLSVDDTASDFNEGSIVIELSYGDIDYLLTGDAGISTEQELISSYDLEAEILKAGHHGSATSTSQEFLANVDPELVVISVGENSYGHPDPTVIDRISNYGSSLYTTLDGTIHIDTDGTSYYVNQEDAPTDGGGTPPPEPPVDETTYAPQIIGKNLSTETVTIQNTGSVDVDMTGWKLLSVEGNQIYTFPDSFILKAGYSVNVNAGRTSVHNPPSDLEWSNAYIWNNSGDKAELYDPAGVLISERP